ncbi:MAG TPA: NUDIX hydrolase [Clostridiales bacterium]|nr:NUDIX hydrolase [Clostridiales bacterium]
MKILKKYKVYDGKYSNFFITEFEDKFGNAKKWEFLERARDTKAVVVNAYHDEKIILVKQFRFPINMYSIEFPAGLIDEGETPEQTALRELTEETGYNGEVTSISPPLCTSAGITSEIIYMVDIKVTSFEGQKLDDTEEIEVLEFDRKNIKTELTDYLKTFPDCSLDARVWAAYFEE